MSEPFNYPAYTEHQKREAREAEIARVAEVALPGCIVAPYGDMAAAARRAFLAAEAFFELLDRRLEGLVADAEAERRKAAAVETLKRKRGAKKEAHHA